MFQFVLTRPERFAFSAFGIVFLISFVTITGQWYQRSTKAIPAIGGAYREGVVGQPRLINPIFAASNDVDRDIAELVFSGLTRYLPDGSIAPDLAERYEISADGKVYTFYLPEGATWHDGKPVTADDIVFTVALMQDTRVESPLRLNWQGVKAEKIADRRVQFTLVNSYAPFLENTTVGILPKHLWEKIPAENLRLAEANLRPVGTGPFEFKRFRKDSLGGVYSYTLTRFAGARRPAYLQTLVFRFFGTEEEVLKAYSKNDIDGFGLVTNRLAEALKKEARRGTNIRTITLPRYFAVFFNQTNSRVLADKSVRKALRQMIENPEVLEQLLSGRGVALSGPIPPGLPGAISAAPTAATPESDPQELLRQGGWKDSDGDGTLDKVLGKDKTATPLSFTLATSDFADLQESAAVLKSAWEKLGVRVEIKLYALPELEREVLRPRQYEALLFGEILSLEPDPFAFWHSTQKRDPGLNLSLYENRAVDKLLEEARQTLDKEARSAKLQE
ncbi:MAG: ABC transporter substrate-binding protein, partial [bacterium]|nr:ABC transporter substrate-binding protein [bacterium]